MLLQRERPLTSARALPRPVPLPSLRHALPARAVIFGPFDLDEPQAAPRGPWQVLGDAARRVIDALADRVRP